MISFILGDHDSDTDNDRKNELGSTILLVRVAIYSAGVLLAFGAFVIPLDKLAIIIGALGVGIGFGLQTMVNNLVSGIILAFEKPIQIGDTIEVGERSGIVKEVDIRSSKLATFDGSEVIVPNGDLLSQHLINWTRNNYDRRVVIPVGIAYGSGLEKVKGIIMQILNDNNDIFTNPEPMIIVKNFGDNSVGLNVYFWTSMSKWFGLKSDMLGTICKKLNEEDVSIPFPQRNLHIKPIDGDVLKNLSQKG